MEAQIKLAGGGRIIQVEGETQKDLFEQMAAAYEVFNETTCGLCGSTNIRPVHRVADKYHFYEYACQEPGCWARLTFGQPSDNSGGLFPVRKLLPNGKPSWKDGQEGPHRGWTKYRGDNQTEEPQSRVPNSLPPEPPFTTLRNLLYDEGVPQGDKEFADVVLKFIFRGNEPAPTLGECAKSEDKARQAVMLFDVNKRKYRGDLLKEAQRTNAGGK